ncbi:MAG: hypothetical protein GC202_12580 [Alphaproteobacteria bacterium]|nr:hypothetical protein [Alphaproteobacteria bacterium]
MRTFFKCLFLLALLSPGLAVAQGSARQIETELAQDFLALELAGWRLPDPVTDCLESLRLKHLEPGTFGAIEMAVDPILVDGAGPFARLVSIDPDPQNRHRRTVRIQWLVPDGTAIRTIADQFTMAINDPGRADEGASGAAAMLREPDRLVVRRECFGG